MPAKTNGSLTLYRFIDQSPQNARDTWASLELESELLGGNDIIALSTNQPIYQVSRHMKNVCPIYDRKFHSQHTTKDVLRNPVYKERFKELGIRDPESLSNEREFFGCMLDFLFPSLQVKRSGLARLSVIQC